MRYFTGVISMVIGMNLYAGLWIEKEHNDFADGREYYYVEGDSAIVWNYNNLRVWDIGAYIYSPASGGLRIVGRDWDLDDNGWLDVVLTWEGNSKVDIYWNSLAGFDTSNKTALLVYSRPQGIALVDIDADKYEDVIIGSFGTSYIPNAVHIFHGSSSGYLSTPSDSIILSFSEVQYSCPADINNDGYVDLIVGGKYKIYIYHGPGPFYGTQPSDSIIFGGACATRIAIVDLNYDGYLDISVSSSHNVGPLYIYSGPNFTSWYTLSAQGNWDHSITDLNKDGYLDVYINHGNSSSDIIYWGSATGFNTSTSIAGNGAGDCSIEDINGDGELDIVATQLGSSSGYIMWGPDYTSYISLPSPSEGQGVEVADFDNDGDKDVLLGGRYSSAYLYWNNSGFSSADKFVFPDHSDDAIFEDLGNLWDRSNKERYLSSIFYTPEQIKVDSVRWWGNFPAGIDMELWMRGTLDTTIWKPWVMLSNGGTDTTLAQISYLQYRCIFSTDYKLTSLFSFDSIKVYYDTLPGGIEITPNVYEFDVQNYPNPCREQTCLFPTFVFSLPEEGKVSLSIYNLAGEKIKKIIDNRYYPTGTYRKIWNMKNDNSYRVGTGVYFYVYKLEIGSGMIKKANKLVVIE